MDTIPDIITKVDMNYIKDMFNNNYLAYKEIINIMNKVEDEEIKEIMDITSTMHYNHLNKIINILGFDHSSLYDEEYMEVNDED